MEETTNVPCGERDDNGCGRPSKRTPQIFRQRWGILKEWANNRKGFIMVSTLQKKMEDIEREVRG